MPNGTTLNLTCRHLKGMDVQGSTQSPRDPRCHLLHLKKRLSVAAHASSRPSSMAHRLPLLQNLALGRYLGEYQSSSLRERIRVRLKRDPESQRGHSGFPVGEDYWGRRRGAPNKTE